MDSAASVRNARAATTRATNTHRDDPRTPHAVAHWARLWRTAPGLRPTRGRAPDIGLARCRPPIDRLPRIAGSANAALTRMAGW